MRTEGSKSSPVRGRWIKPGIAGDVDLPTRTLKKYMPPKYFGIWAMYNCIKDESTGLIPENITDSEFVSRYNKTKFPNKYGGPINKTDLKNANRRLEKVGLSEKSEKTFLRLCKSGGKTYVKETHYRVVYGRWFDGQCTIPKEAYSKLISGSHGGRRSGAGRSSSSCRSETRKFREKTIKSASEKRKNNLKTRSNEQPQPQNRNSNNVCKTLKLRIQIPKNEAIKLPQLSFKLPKRLFKLPKRLIKLPKRLPLSESDFVEEQSKIMSKNKKIDGTETSVTGNQVTPLNRSNSRSNSRSFSKEKDSAQKARSTSGSQNKVDRNLPLNSEEGERIVARTIPPYPDVDFFRLPTLPDPPLLPPDLKPLEQAEYLLKVYRAVSSKVFGKPSYVLRKNVEKSKYFKDLVECADIMRARNIAPFAWVRWRFDQYLSDKKGRKIVKPPPLPYVFPASMMEKHHKFFHSQSYLYHPRTPIMSYDYKSLLYKHTNFTNELKRKKSDLKTVGEALDLISELYKKHFGGFDKMKEHYERVEIEAAGLRKNIKAAFERGEDVWSYRWRGK